MFIKKISLITVFLLLNMTNFLINQKLFLGNKISISVTLNSCKMSFYSKYIVL